MDSKKHDMKRVESLFEIKAFLERLKYVVRNKNSTIKFQIDRDVDKNRLIKHTNRYTILSLFPNESPTEILKRELLNITEHEYIATVKDNRYPNRSDMRIFGKKYEGEDVYIKIRVELLDPNESGLSTVFIMSFHFAENAFTENEFPYRKENPT